MLRVLRVARAPLLGATAGLSRAAAPDSFKTLLDAHEGCSAAAFQAARMAATGPKTATPPADAARGATADLCDVFIKEPVDLVRQHPVSIVQPIFRWARCNLMTAGFSITPNCHVACRHAEAHLRL